MRQLVLAAMLVAAACSFAQDNCGNLVRAPGRPAIDCEHTNWIAGVLKEIETIKPGMTRADLLKVFTTEGGLSVRWHREFVYKSCPYVKVDVQFEPVEGESAVSEERPDDKIVSISRPYLQWSIMD